MKIVEFLHPAAVAGDLPGATAQAVLAELCKPLATARRLDPEKLQEVLVEREKLGSTGIGSGVAIPHCKMRGIERAVVAVGASRRPVDFGAVDSEPVRLFFLVVSPHDTPAVHLQVLASISRWVKADRHVPRLLAMRDRQEMYDFLRQEGT
jgi:mannitol/fructose-specific phosphotransferase system IIA component (Ntr-type)